MRKFPGIFNLLAAVLVVLCHSIGSTIQADYRDMGILITVGFTSADLHRHPRDL